MDSRPNFRGKYATSGGGRKIFRETASLLDFARVQIPGVPLLLSTDSSYYAGSPQAHEKEEKDIQEKLKGKQQRLIQQPIEKIYSYTCYS